MHPAVAAALANADDVRSWQEELYRDLHQHPELSHQEHRTAAAVADRLQQTGFEVTTGVGGTGVVGILRNGEGATVLLRADMDALPVLEDTGLPYASTATGRPSDPTALCRSHTPAVTTCTPPACWAPPGCWRWPKRIGRER